MKNILYIAPYRQIDEWGKNSKAFLNLLLNNNNIDLTIRPVWFNHNNNYYEESNLIEKYEFKKIKNKDILIQYGLPNYLNYDGSFKKNIAITHIDCHTNNIGWDEHLNLFDKVIVFSEFEKQILLESNIKTDIFNFKYPPFYGNTNDNIKEINLGHLKNNFIFYASLSKDIKSGIKELLTSYLSSFDTLDNVILILLHNENDFEKEIDNIKNLLNIYGDHEYYPNIALINYSDEIINYLHLNGDCYIDVSYNSRISQHTLKAIYNQKPILLLENSKIMDEYPLYVKTHDEIINYNNRPIYGLYSGEYSWKIPNTCDLRNKLKQIYYNSNNIRDIAIQKIMKLRTSIFDINQYNLEEALCI